jgi:type II secretory pathway component PulF
MPVYRWKGLDAENRLHQGVLFSASEAHLREQLLEKDIGLLEAGPPLLTPRFSESAQYRFFNQLASLIQSHIPLHSALIIIASTHKNKHHQAIIENIADLISQGAPLYDALSTHGLSDELTKMVIMVSEQTGALGPALQALADHRSTIAELKSKMRSALIGPAITFFFFLVIMLCLFIYVIPQFERYFLSYNAALPPLTSFMLSLSRFIRSWQGMVVAGALPLMPIFAILLAKRRYKRSFDELVFRLPLVSAVLRSIYTARILKCMGMLLSRGVPLSHAYTVCIETIDQARVRRELCTMQSSIEGGASLLSSWKQSFFASAETEAYIAMGESTGQLGLMLDRAGSSLLQKIYASLQRFVALVQPLLLLLLGLCVAALLVAVYMPLLTLSEIMF